jgi:DMSO/TMAO reductase YedYZ molybdopterin-dependent catalytic subunit
MDRWKLPALAGLLAVAAGAAVAELVAAVLGRPQAGTVVAVGGVLVDAAPTPVKEFAVATLGTADKPVLLGGIAVVLAVLAAALGVGARRDPRIGVAGAVALGVVGGAAALSRRAADVGDVLPSLVGMLVVIGVLPVLLRHLRPPAAPAAVVSGGSVAAVPDGERPRRTDSDDPAVRPDGTAAVDRRRFLVAAALVGAGSAAAAGGATVLRRSPVASLTLPAPADPAPPLPAGLDPGFVTSNADFYRVDTALTVPRVDLGSWRLRIGGRVAAPVELSFADLLDRPLVERVVTLNCVSNEVGGPYIGTARWLGVPLAPLLREVGVQAGADQLLARSVDGMTIGTPTAALFDGREPLLCVGMNGEPLPPEHGFPVRMLTPGLFGYTGACKWITELEATTFDAVDAYWTARDWDPQGVVRTASRIDTPGSFSRPDAGPVVVAGVAWAQGRGVRAVEVRVDDGPWQPAALLPVPSVDTWVQWRFPWNAAPGDHTVQVRATDGTGAVQPEVRATPFPSGATGWHTISVTVG